MVKECLKYRPLIVIFLPLKISFRKSCKKIGLGGLRNLTDNYAHNILIYFSLINSFAYETLLPAICKTLYYTKLLHVSAIYFSHLHGVTSFVYVYCV